MMITGVRYVNIRGTLRHDGPLAKARLIPARQCSSPCFLERNPFLRAGFGKTHKHTFDGREGETLKDPLATLSLKRNECVATEEGGLGLPLRSSKVWSQIRGLGVWSWI